MLNMPRQNCTQNCIQIHGIWKIIKIPWHPGEPAHSRHGRERAGFDHFLFLFDHFFGFCRPVSYLVVWYACMYVCMYIHIHIYLVVRMSNICIHMHTHVRIYINIPEHTCIHAYLRQNMYVCACMCACVRVCVCLCVHTHAHTHKKMCIVRNMWLYTWFEAISFIKCMYLHMCMHNLQYWP